MTKTMTRCGNCGRRCAEIDLAVRLPDIPDLAIRLVPGSEVPAGECSECGALVYIDLENAEAPQKWVVAFYDSDQVYGGSEEGGWWYHAGQLIRVSREFDDEEAAYIYCRRLNDKLDAWQDRAGVPKMSSVLSRGRVDAHVFHGAPPAHYPETTPHYE